jgi:hypothetical protein
MGEHKAAVRLVGLRHAKKGSIIAEALEIIDPLARGQNGKLKFLGKRKCDGSSGNHVIRPRVGVGEV